MPVLEKGYLKLPSLSSEKCDSIVEQLRDIPFKARTKNHIITGLHYDEAQSNIYEVVNQHEVLNITEVGEISKDPNILSIVREYLGAEPILTQTGCWWSGISKSSEQSKAAQLFHQDRTYKKFIKLFLYLNDVTRENGCHVYVPNSIKKGPEPAKSHLSQRVSDEYICENYSEILYLTGSKGAMTLVDTQGWHKGNPVTKGHRLLVQLEWSSDAIYLHTGKVLKYV